MNASLQPSNKGNEDHYRLRHYDAPLSAAEGCGGALAPATRPRRRVARPEALRSAAGIFNSGG